MAEIRILDHTADVRVEVSADTLEDLFRGALEALTGLLKRETASETGEAGRETLRWERSDPEEDLVVFLSEALSLCQVRKAVCRLEWIRFGDKSHVAVLVFRESSGFDGDVKAVTYHDALLEADGKGGWRSAFVLDI